MKFMLNVDISTVTYKFCCINIYDRINLKML